MNISDIPKIEAKRWSHVEQLQEILNGDWKKIFSEAKNLKIFFGKKNKKYVIFKFDGQGLSHDTPSDTEEDYYLVVPDEELPLLISKKMDTKCIEVLKNRLKGDLCRPPERQDLVNLYYSCRKLIERTYSKIEKEQEIMMCILRDYIAPELRKLPFPNNHYVSLCVNKRTYLYHTGNDKFITPEDIKKSIMYSCLFKIPYRFFNFLFRRNMNTLRDINIKLKGGNIDTVKRTKKNPIVFKIWIKRENVLEFFTDVSTLNYYKNRWSRDKCPYCGKMFSTKDIVSKTIISWIFQCQVCKSLLKVYNE